VRDQNRKSQVAQDTVRRPAKNKIAYSRVAVTAHHQKAGAALNGFFLQGNRDIATVIEGGKRFGEQGYFIEPTMFGNVRDEMSIAKDEIFGPVLSVLKFKDVNEIVDRANNTMFGLAAAVWTRDISKAHHLAAKIKAGTVWINCYDVFDAAAPFGGFKMSGLGRELGERGLDAYTETKTVTVSLG